MNLLDFIPGVLATLATTGVIALVAAMLPGPRWSRQLARETAIYGALPEGGEREAWERRVLDHARRLRLFEDFMPLRHKIFPWVPVTVLLALMVWLIIDPQQWDGLLAEGPIMVPFSLMALISAGSFVMTGVLGLTPNGRSAEHFAAQE